MIFGLFGDKTESEARQLNRDAPLIIEQSEQTYPPTRLRDMAEMIVEFIERAHVRYGTQEIDLKRAHHDYKSLHKEARRKNDQIELSAMTLVIIYIRAEIAGPLAAPAREAIDAFTGAWLSDGDAAASEGAEDGGPEG
ncbi:MAG: hypothetical protein OXR84_03205 [Magnetovibrio sp.]|nr:hypothetical protein [Magnetovibrio sp.]